MIRRNDDASFDAGLLDFDERHPFSCSLDEVCSIAKRFEKNHLNLNVILTSGYYILEIWDVSTSEYWDFLWKEMDLSRVPFSMEIQSYPVLQNEAR